MSYGDKTINGVPYIQHTATITYYSAGGPLVDEYGSVIGIARLKPNRTESLDLAIPISKATSIEQNMDLSVAEFLQLAKE